MWHRQCGSNMYWMRQDIRRRVHTNGQQVVPLDLSIRHWLGRHGVFRNVGSRGAEEAPERLSELLVEHLQQWRGH